MKQRKQSIIGGLDRILSVQEASAILQIPEQEIEQIFVTRQTMSLRNLLKRMCGTSPILFFPIVGEDAYTLKGVMAATSMGRSWCLEFINRNRIRNWCVGVHYLFSKKDVDEAWARESVMWSEWIPLQNVSCLYGLDIRTLLQQVANGRIRTKSGNRELLVSHKDIKALWKTRDE